MPEKYLSFSKVYTADFSLGNIIFLCKKIFKYYIKTVGIFSFVLECIQYSVFLSTFSLVNIEVTAPIHHCCESKSLTLKKKNESFSTFSSADEEGKWLFLHMS